ncbi:MAG: His/Gly/Thr/Pro-type tRNA ligase C-terminal domain-containing protein, partial [Solirubrobacteraceae bacterium]
VDLFVARATPEAGRSAFALAAEGRRAGLSAQLELAGRSLKGQLKQADRLGARYVAIVGDEALISLKDMESGDQRELEPATVIPTILRASRLL